MARARTKKWNSKFLRKLEDRALTLLSKALPAGIIFGIVISLFLSVRQMLYADPYFQVARITVFPSSVLTSSEYDFLERQAAGKSLLEMRLKELSQILERNPKVKRAEVVRQLPNQLQIYLTLRQPFIQVQMKDGGPYYLVADDQFILSAQDSPKPNLVTLQDFTGGKRVYGPGMLYENRYFKLLSSNFQAIKSEPLLAAENITLIAMDQLGHVTLILHDGVELRAGNEISLSDAGRTVLATLLKSEERSQILYIDLRYRDIIVKKRSQASDGKTG